MARRRKEEAEAVSLFPFLSILACLIGVLTLMITALALGQMDREQSQDDLARYEHYTELQATLEDDQAELKALQTLVSDAAELERQLQAALAELELLEADQAEVMQREDVDSEHARMLAESNRLRRRIAEIENDPAELRKLIDELQSEIEQRNAGPSEAVVQVRPGGSGVEIEPTFVECTASDVAILGGPEPVRIRLGDLDQPGGKFHQLLDSVAGTPRGQVIFLVRPDGVGAYNTARNVARSHYSEDGYARHGKLPVPSQGHIDLSVFQPASAELPDGSL